ncbi:MAG: hypothetical protein BroJett006_28420 [Betaproteobacteria bacterium]|nr:MAG: hypothetical protein BroJett006_28420 [Betaproteobacteria bacterium]
MHLINVPLINSFLLGASIFLSYAIALAVEQEPLVVVRAEALNFIPGTSVQPDSPLVRSSVGEKLTWLLAVWDKTHGGIMHLETSGPLDNPINTQKTVRRQHEFFTSGRYGLDGILWIVNTYDAGDGTLAFVHVEHAEHTGTPGQIGKSRIGLAWRPRDAEKFHYLGHVISPFGDPDPHNIQGAPYLIRGGYFLVYFHDSTGLAVARAPVAEVLEAARHGHTSDWWKYASSEAGFSSAGLGGKSKRLNVDGISHGDAACSTVSDKCYLLLTRMNWKGEDTWIRLFETQDGVSFRLVRTIVQQPATSVRKGYQFASIVNEDGTDNAVVGRRFYIYAYKDHQERTRTMLRWTVEIE